MNDLDDLATAHLAWLTAENSVAANTIKARRAVLRSVGNPGTATREEIEAWWASRRDHARSTRLADLSHLRRFFRWCRIWEHRPDDPSERIEAPRQDKGMPRPFTRSQVQTILAAATPEMRRAVALGVYAGLRVSEAAALDWADIDLETRRIRVELSKGRKTRAVGLSPLLLDEIGPEVAGNVVTAGAKAYTADSLQRKVNRAIRAAGVDGTFHQLRHRFGTVTVAETGNLLAVSRAMGHSSVATTSRYTETSDEALDLIAAAAAR